MSDSVKASSEGSDQTRNAIKSVEEAGFIKGHRTRASRSRSAAIDLPSRNGDTNGTGGERQADEIELDKGDDSEAETVLSSPVKRREALKKSVASIDAVLKSGTSQEDEDDNSAKSDGPMKTQDQAVKAEPSDKGVIHGNGNEIDTVNVKVEDTADTVKTTAMNTSGLDVRSSPLSADFRDDESDVNVTGDDTNPRKRKHREFSSAVKSSVSSSSKRQRRSSVNGRSGSDGDSDGSLPPGRVARQTRLSSQSHANDDDTGKLGTGRSRRAASGLVLHPRQPTPSAWESDSNSELSAKPLSAKSGGILARSVSTPGRPPGRDHKRHVNRYGFTRLAEACENGDLEAVKEWRDKDPEQLTQREFAGNTPLQIASLNGYPEIVSYLLSEGADVNCANTDQDTPLIDAVENSHIDVVKVLLDAGVNPSRQNMKGHSALDVITEDTENGQEMRALLREAIESYAKRNGEDRAEQVHVPNSRPGPKQGLHFMARTPDNLLKLVANSDREGTQEFLDARVPVDNTIVAAAAKTGDLYLLNMLLAEMSPSKAKSKAEKPMLAVLGSSQFEVVKTLTELDQFNPLWRSKANGMTWYQLAESRNGPHWREECELLRRLFSEAQSHRLSSSPISKKDGIRRARSPATSRESDIDADGADSPDHGRKRRLLSRKDLRVANSRRTSPASSERAASSPEAVAKPPPSDELKPRRKPGRPRTKSLSATNQDPKMARLKASRENLALFDTMSNGHTKRKPSVSSTSSRPVMESIVESKREKTEGNKADVTKTQNEDTIMTDAAAEEEKKQAAAKAKEEADKLAQAKLLAEQKLAEEQKLREENIHQAIQAYPDALRCVMQLDGLIGKERMIFVAKHFLPVHAVTGAALGEANEAEALYMTTYQAAGLLGGKAARTLLELDDRHVLETQLIRDVPKRPLTSEEKLSVFTAIGPRNIIASLDHGSRPDNYSIPHPQDGVQAITARYKALQKTWNAMPPVHWIKVREFLHLKARLQIAAPADYPHLVTIPAMEVNLDVILGGKRPGSAALPLGLSGTRNVLDDDEAVKEELRQGLKDGDGKWFAPPPLRYRVKVARVMRPA